MARTLVSKKKEELLFNVAKINNKYRMITVINFRDFKKLYILYLYIAS